MRQILICALLFLVGCGGSSTLTQIEDRTVTLPPIVLPTIETTSGEFIFLESPEMANNEGSVNMGLRPEQIAWVLENYCKGEIHGTSEGVDYSVAFRMERVKVSELEALVTSHEYTIAKLEGKITTDISVGEREVSIKDTTQFVTKEEKGWWDFMGYRLEGFGGGIILVLLILLVMQFAGKIPKIFPFWGN